MKLRIKDNSIRLRLTQSEVGTIARGGHVHAETAFPGGATLRYRLEAAPSGRPEASFHEGSLVVGIPGDDLRRWATGTEVSIDAIQSLEDAGSLKLLVEKDFACLAPREGEDEADMFPHPLQGES